MATQSRCIFLGFHSLKLTVRTWYNQQEALLRSKTRLYTDDGATHLLFIDLLFLDSWTRRVSRKWAQDWSQHFFPVLSALIPRWNRAISRLGKRRQIWHFAPSMAGLVLSLGQGSAARTTGCFPGKNCKCRWLPWDAKMQRKLSSKWNRAFWDKTWVTLR